MARWAIRVYKSQGVTLSSVIADLDLCFEERPAYVALSRATSLQSLIVSSLSKLNCKGTDPEVDRFMLETFGEQAVGNGVIELE